MVNEKKNQEKKNQAKAKESNPKQKDGAIVQKKPFAYHLIPYVFAVLAVFFLMCFITNLICNPANVLGENGEKEMHILGLVGYYVCEVTMGVFGPAAFALPVLLFFFVIFWKNYNRRSFVALNAVFAFIAAAVVSALVHIFMHMKEGNEAFSNTAKLLYNEGAALGGGGIVGGFVSFALVSVLNVLGACFVLVVILIPIVLFLCGTTPVEAAQWIAKKCRESSAKGAERRIVKKEKRHAEALKKQEEKEALAEAKKKAEEKRLAEEARRQEEERKEAEQESLKLKAVADEDDNADEGVEVKIAALSEMKETRTTIKINNDSEPEKAVTENASDEEGKKDEEEDGGAALTYSVFSKEDKQKMDGIKDSDGPELDKYEQDELGAEKVFPASDTEGQKEKKPAVVFVDPNSRSEARGMGVVDDMLSEQFEEVDGAVVNTETGEVVSDKNTFTPKVQTKKAKSADEFRAENEKHEDCFIGDKPEPAPIPEYNFPPADLLEMGPTRYSSDPAEIQANADKLQEVLQDFKIPIKEITCSCGPTLTRYEIKPEAGVRVKQIANLVDDIAMALAKSGVRIEAPIPGKAAVGIEVPNDKSTPVKLRNLIENPDFTENKSKLASCLGADVSGKPVVFDIEKMPHLLVAGTTGSGKSVCINSIIMSILYHAKPNEVKLLLVDPKKVEFKIYKDIPHLCCRIVSDPKKAAGALNLAVNEMEKRFSLIEEVGVRNITGYNEITKNDPEKPYMPRMVIIIDEFADLMMTAKDEVETAVVRIAQKARAAGIHLIIGTQRPSVDVITGLIKANIPSRIAFTVMSGIDSRTIIDTVGAEKLCGRGDMLYAPVGAQKPQRVQGAFVSDEEVERVVDYVKSHNAPVIYDTEFENQLEVEAAKYDAAPEKGSSSGGGDIKGGSGDDDKLFDAAVLAIESGKISTSLLQRRLEVGYGRAAKIIDRLEEMGIVGPADGNKPRKILVSMDELASRFAGEE